MARAFAACSQLTLLRLKDQPSPSLARAFTAARFTLASDVLGTNHPIRPPARGAASMFATRPRSVTDGVGSTILQVVLHGLRLAALLRLPCMRFTMQFSNHIRLALGPRSRRVETPARVLLFVNATPAAPGSREVKINGKLDVNIKVTTPRTWRIRSFGIS